VGGELSTHVEYINAYRILVGKLEGRGVDGRKILILTLNKEYGMRRTGLCYIRFRIRGRLLRFFEFLKIVSSSDPM
jgi:hypothetical protein